MNIKTAMLLLFVPMACSASPISMEQAASILNPTAAEGAFTEEKTLPDVPNPVVSRGRYKLDDDAVEWRTIDPFETLLKLTPRGISYEYDGEAFELSSEDAPGIGTLSIVFSSVLHGDFNLLQKLFRLEFDKTDEIVTIKAVPADSSAAPDLKKITLKGRTSLETILIEFNSGAVTFITLGSLEQQRL